MLVVRVFFAHNKIIAVCIAYTSILKKTYVQMYNVDISLYYIYSSNSSHDCLNKATYSLPII